jgi:hypothetical protein
MWLEHHRALDRQLGNQRRIWPRNYEEILLRVFVSSWPVMLLINVMPMKAVSVQPAGSLEPHVVCRSIVL